MVGNVSRHLVVVGTETRLQHCIPTGLVEWCRLALPTMAGTLAKPGDLVEGAEAA